jgi:hypothetical protein
MEESVLVVVLNTDPVEAQRRGHGRCYTGCEFTDRVLNVMEEGFAGPAAQLLDCGFVVFIEF